MTRTPSNSTLAIRAFAKVRRLRDEQAKRVKRAEAQVAKHNDWMLESGREIIAASDAYRELTGEKLPDPAAPSLMSLAAASSADAE